jgi:hypothetical protein
MAYGRNAALTFTRYDFERRATNLPSAVKKNLRPKSLLQKTTILKESISIYAYTYMALLQLSN